MSTEPLVQPESSGLSTFSAARWNVQVLTEGNYGDGDEKWTWWNGLNKFEPSQDPTMQDDTDINSDSFKSQLVTATSEDCSAEGMVKGRKSANVLPVDPGTAYVRSKRHETGEDNVITLRYWRRDELQTQAIVQNFAVSWKDVGGTIEDIQKFTADLKGRGKPLFVDRPAQTTKVLTVPSAVTAFTISINGTPTASIDNDTIDATAAVVRAAIEAHPDVEPGDVTVTGPQGGPFTITLLIELTELATTGTGGVTTLTDPA